MGAAQPATSKNASFCRRNGRRPTEETAPYENVNHILHALARTKSERDLGCAPTVKLMTDMRYGDVDLMVVRFLSRLRSKTPDA
jgi:hypothetical protein